MALVFMASTPHVSACCGGAVPAPRHAVDLLPFPTCVRLLGFVAAASSGILQKRKGGRINTLKHAYSMVTAFAFALGGWYVIYQQKKMLSKPHNTSWHAWMGLLAIAGFAAGAFGGGVAPHPDFGVARRNASIRMLHKLSSRAAAAAAFASVFSGTAKLAGASLTTLVGVALALLAWKMGLLERPGAKLRHRIPIPI